MINIRNLISQKASKDTIDFINKIKHSGAFDANPKDKAYVLSWGLTTDETGHSGIYSMDGDPDQIPEGSIRVFEHFYNKDDKNGAALVSMFCTSMYYHSGMYELSTGIFEDTNTVIKMIKTIAKQESENLVSDTIEIFLNDMGSMVEFLSSSPSIDNIYMTSMEEMESLEIIKTDGKDPYLSKVKLKINIEKKEHEFICNAYQAVIIAVSAKAFSFVERSSPKGKEVFTESFVRLLHASGFKPE